MFKIRQKSFAHQVASIKYNQILKKIYVQENMKKYTYNNNNNNVCVCVSQQLLQSN